MPLTRSAFLVTLLGSLGTAQPQPETLIWTPDTIKWQPDDPPGSKYAVLYGDRDRPGSLFTYAFWLPGGVWAPVHSHSQAAHVAVMQGRLQLGFDTTTDRSKTRAISAGGFFVVPANQPHYEGSDGECLLIGTAQGGWKTTVLSDHKVF